MITGWTDGAIHAPQEAGTTMTATRRLGLALGSGGARGLAHAGVLRVLERNGLRPDLIVGTSMGAIVGGLYAETMDAEETWRRLHTFTQDEEFLDTWAPFVAKGSPSAESRGRIQSLFTSASRLFMQFRTITQPSLVGAEKLRKPLERLFRARDFADLTIPFQAVGVDLISGERALFREGDLLDAIYASAAIPGVFPPLAVDGRMVVDGGSPYRVPVNTCRAFGADVVVGVVLPGFESAKPEYKTGLEIMQRCEAIARERLDHYVLPSADVIIRPDVSEYHWADFAHDEACLTRGEEAAEQAVTDIAAAMALPPAKPEGWRHRLRRFLVGV
jgi:NTE family protein